MKCWFITGVSSGIGAALAKAVLDRGDMVIGTVRRRDALAAFEAQAPGRAHGLMLDLDEPGQISPAVEEAIGKAGRIDVVVNNAGRSVFGAVEETDREEALGLYKTNVLGPMGVMQAFLPHFRANGGGTFVNLSSGCGLFGVPGVGAYCASKFALEGLSETLAQEVAPFNVKVMIVEPGAVSGQFISHGTTESANRMTEYDFLTGNGKALFDPFYENFADSPETVAQSIISALESEEVPLRLVVGGSVKEGAKAKGEAFLALGEA